MKFIYFLLPLVSSALANSLIKCPCNQQDCSKAADPCNCENHNIVNKYFCCDANTVAPEDLGLKDCKNSTLTVLGLDEEYYSGICGGPDDLSCADPHGTCNELSGPGAADDNDIDATPWGLCSHPRGPSHSPESIGSATMIIFSTPTASASSSNSPNTGTPSVPVSTSTIVETTTAAPSALVVVTTTTTTSTTPKKSTPSILVVVTTTTTTTSTTSKKSAPSTLVVVTTTTTTSTTSTKGSPSAISN